MAPQTRNEQSKKSPKIHRFAIVLDSAFGLELSDLSTRVHVWVCDSPENRKVVGRVWAHAKDFSLEKGITIFKYEPNDSPEQIRIDILDTCDLHHGEYGHHLRWSVLEVYGTDLTSDIKAALGKFGVTSFKTTELGFNAFRDGAEDV